MKSHKDLDVWKAAVSVAKDTYRLTASFPKEEQFGMTSQMRRSSISIASNIAEGAARQGNKEFVRFLHIALGSAAELETQIVIAREVGLGDDKAMEKLDQDLTQIRHVLQGLIRSLKAT